MDDDSLWAIVHRTDTSPALVLIALKKPELHRGFFRGTVLLSKEEYVEANARLRKGAQSVVPLADRAIGNLQQWLVGTHHGVSRAQLQVYLDEFAFRHNRRRKPTAAFQTLLGLGAGRAPTPYRRIRGAQDVEASG